MTLPAYSYLQSLATTFAREVGPEQIPHYTFVFPNRRAGLFFRKYLAAALPRPVLAPAILTINDCFYELSDLTVLDSLQLLFRVYDAYRLSTPSPESFDQFLYWGKLMLSDFSEIDNHLIPNVRELFTSIRDLKQIDLEFDYLTDTQRQAISEFWGDFLKSDKENSQINRNFLYIWDLLWPVYTRLRDNLLGEKLAYDGLLHRQLIEHWDEIPAERFREHYVFVGFNALTRSEEQLMIRLQDMSIADFYFDYSNPYVSDPDNRASLFMQHNRATFRSRYEVPVCLQAEREITHIAIPSTIGEAHEVYRLLCDIHPANGNDHDFTRTAIVLPDERMLQPLLTAIPEQIDKINVTMGYPLSSTPIYALLQLLESLRARATEAGFYHKDVIALLAHRYIRLILGEEEVQTLQRHIQDHNLIYVPIENEVFDRQTPLLAYLRRVITRIPDTNAEDIYLVLTAINRVEDALRLYPHISAQDDTIAGLMTLLLSDQTIPYAGEPLEGLQVMGVLETRALDFDTLIITGFNDDLYPGNSHSNSYIPYSLRRGFGLPTPERQDAIFAYNFYRMIGYAKRVYLLTNSRSDDQHSGEASRYLSQLIYQYHLPVQQVLVVPENHTRPTTLRTIQKSPAIREEIRLFATKKGLSATALNDYLRCPLSFYWKHIRRIKPPKEVSEQMEANEFGELFHSLMQQLYEPYRDKEVTAQTIRDAIRPKLDSEWFSSRVGNQATQLEQQVLREFLHLLLDQDERCAPFHYVDSEREVHTSITLDDTTTVRFIGFIDRIDRCNGRTRLIDYKTGHADLDYADIPSLFDAENKTRNEYALQTILYCIMYENKKKSQLNTDESQSEAIDIEPHIYSVRQLGKGTLTTAVTEKKASSFSLQDVREPFLDGLRQLAATILSDTPLTPATDTRCCENCTFAPLCS